MTHSAELLADAGAAAAGASPEDFFRSARFLAAEGVTHTLLIAGDPPLDDRFLITAPTDDAPDFAGSAPTTSPVVTTTRFGRGHRPAVSGTPPQARELEIGHLAVPLVVSEIPGTDRRDAVSPYGYPGGSGASGLDPATIDFSGTGLVSVFVRDRVGEATCLGGGTLRTHVQIADPSLPRKSRMSDRQQVRRNLRKGWAVETIAGTEVGVDQRAGFERAYGETMARTQAAPRYDFSSEYFAAVLDGEGAWLVLAHAPGEWVGAGALVVRSDGFLHYYLSGTADAHLADSPMKNIIEAMIELAQELGLPLNLGGGARPGDNLESFKRGFANREEPFHTHEIICDPEAYAKLSAGRPETGFFPAYRS